MQYNTAKEIYARGSAWSYSVVIILILVFFSLKLRGNIWNWFNDYWKNIFQNIRKPSRYRTFKLFKKKLQSTFRIYEKFEQDYKNYTLAAALISWS